MSQPLQIDREHLQKLLESAFVLQQGESTPVTPPPSLEPAPASPEEFRALIQGLPGMLQEGTIELDEAFDLIALHLQRSTEADGVAAALLEGHEILYHAATGLSRSLYGIRVRPEATLFHGLLHPGEQLVSPETSEDLRLDHMLCQLRGARSLAALPIVHQGAMVGAWEVVSERGHAFSEAAVACCAVAAELAAQCLAAGGWVPDVQEPEDLAAWAKTQTHYRLRPEADAPAAPAPEAPAAHVTSDALLHAEVAEAAPVIAAAPRPKPPVPAFAARAEAEAQAEPRVSRNFLVRQWQTNRANVIIVIAAIIFAGAALWELATAMGWLEHAKTWVGALSAISDSQAGVVPPPVLTPATRGNPQAPVWISLQQGQYNCGGNGEEQAPLGFVARQREAQLAHFEPARGEPCP